MVLLSVLMLCTSKNALFLWHIKYTQHAYTAVSKTFALCIKCVTSVESRAGCRLLVSGQMIAKKSLSLHLSLLLGCGRLEKPWGLYRINGPGLRKKYRRLNIQSFHLHCCCLWWSLIQIKWNIIVLSDASNHTPGPIGEAFGNKGVNNPGRFTCLPSGDGL